MFGIYSIQLTIDVSLFQLQPSAINFIGFDLGYLLVTVARRGKSSQNVMSHKDTSLTCFWFWFFFEEVENCRKGQDIRLIPVENRLTLFQQTASDNDAYKTNLVGRYLGSRD